MQSRQGTLVAATIAPIVIGGDPVDGFARAQQVEVLNRDGTAEIWFTVNGTAPTVGGNDSYCCPAAIGAQKVDVATDGPVTIKLISTGTPKYLVTVLP